MTFAEARKLAEDIRKFADFVENRAPLLPYTTFDVSARCYLTQSDYIEVGHNDDGSTKWDTVINEAETKERMAKFLEAVGSCEKEYSDDSLKITKKFGDCKVIGRVDRSLTCKRKVVGKRTEPAVNLPEREVDIVEWECDDAPSLLALVKE